jgi:hypothetical protein
LVSSRVCSALSRDASALSTDACAEAMAEGDGVAVVVVAELPEPLEPPELDRVVLLEEAGARLGVEVVRGVVVVGRVVVVGVVRVVVGVVLVVVVWVVSETKSV